MSESIFVRETDFASAEKTIRTILSDVDAGKYDQELSQSGVTRPQGKLLDGLDLSMSGQGMSPNEWFEIIAIFGPVVATAAKDVWSIIVVPKLKRAFRDDCVSPNNPKQNK